MFRSFFSLVIKSVRHRPVRSWLTILGIVIGIMLVVVIFSLGDGIKGVVSKTLQAFGSDLIIVFPGKESNPFAGVLGGQKFKVKDVMPIEQIAGVRFVVPVDAGIINVEYHGEKKSTFVHGGPWEHFKLIYEESRGVRLEQGRWPLNDDAPEVVLGNVLASNLFKNQVKVGDEIIMKSKRMRVVGILSKIGAQDDDNSLYISLNLFHALTGRANDAMSVLIKAEPDANLELIGKEVRIVLSRQEVVRDFSVLTPAKVNNLVGSVLQVIELVLIIIALISLVVGAVGIMNTMYTSVLERTKQIGIMKAVGASRDAIMSLFLIESGLIGLVGGMLGIILGLVCAYLVGMVAVNFGIVGLFSFASLDVLALIALLSFTFVVGIISGVLPARQAARMEPSEALRYE